jgi:hypothetical protein
VPAISSHTANAAAGRGLPRIALTIVAITAVIGLACKQDESSSLRDRSQPIVEVDPSASASAPEASAEGEPATAPPEDAELVSLRLALPQDETYRVTTVAMVELPMVNQPVGWAREEQITFESCDGEGEGRGCTLRHRSTAFEGQPPTGPMLEADERKVQPVTSRHRMTAVGFRDGPTELEIDASAEVEADLEASLAAVHRFYCIRFPKQPVGVGAKWNDTCQTFDRGIAVTRRVLWELSELSDDPDDPDAGKRAELRGIGEYLVPGPKGERKGTVETIFYFFVDEGEPHLIRERRSVPVSAERGAYTKETINIQFAKVVAGEPQQVVRTDGKPFPESAPASEAAPEASEATP